MLTKFERCNSARHFALSTGMTVGVGTFWLLIVSTLWGRLASDRTPQGRVYFTPYICQPPTDGNALSVVTRELLMSHMALLPEVLRQATSYVPSSLKSPIAPTFQLVATVGKPPSVRVAPFISQTASAPVEG